MLRAAKERDDAVSPGPLELINGNRSATRPQRDAAALVQAFLPYCREAFALWRTYLQLRAKSESSLGL
jgi:hypothetical protein